MYVYLKRELAHLHTHRLYEINCIINNIIFLEVFGYKQKYIIKHLFKNDELTQWTKLTDYTIGLKIERKDEIFDFLKNLPHLCKYENCVKTKKDVNKYNYCEEHLDYYNTILNNVVYNDLSRFILEYA